MSVTETTFDNYQEHRDLLLMSKTLRTYANENTALESFITELEASIWGYLGVIELHFIQSRYENHLKIMAELGIESQS